MPRFASPSEAEAAARAFDLKKLPADFIEDPYPYFHALRDYDPVHRMPDGSYIITRYDDCETLYKDAKTYSSDKKIEFFPKYGDTPLFEHHTTSLVFNDPPLHTQVRRAIAGALSPRAIAEMEAGLVELVDRLLGELERKGRVDLIEDFASAIPVEIIGNLLGVPHEERGPLRGWSLAILGALEPVLTEAQLKAGNDAVREFLAYLKILTDDRRRNPGDPNKDVLTRLIIGEHEGRKLTETELLQNCIFILNAGHETTTNLIGNALYTLLQWPDEKARLMRDPSLMKTAIEEVLRFESSNQLGNRRVVVDTVLGGVPMKEGDLITIAIAAANRDPKYFPDPDRFDVGRTPNRHLAFASGVHVCAGMNVARLEGRIALERFLARFPNYRLDGEPVRSPRARFRGFVSLPAVVG
ncbi:cytochrome P450 [Pseudorhodoplanes sp.]|uniref:cytochrome P450 n=1 Tax=Pseudorhodoplanes sp. TaxID=1934341 RepID=UPI002C8DFB8A|nr:cytochrome P450 [Pseudorhodoplanes sp.]HWV55122.1 cytochrome P450 [Pseudorhodoplanes sp.]